MHPVRACQRASAPPPAPNHVRAGLHRRSSRPAAAPASPGPHLHRDAVIPRLLAGVHVSAACAHAAALLLLPLLLLVIVLAAVKDGAGGQGEPGFAPGMAGSRRRAQSGHAWWLGGAPGTAPCPPCSALPRPAPTHHNLAHLLLFLILLLVLKLHCHANV